MIKIILSIISFIVNQIHTTLTHWTAKAVNLPSVCLSHDWNLEALTHKSSCEKSVNRFLHLAAEFSTKMNTGMNDCLASDENQSFSSSLAHCYSKTSLHNLLIWAVENDQHSSYDICWRTLTWDSVITAQQIKTFLHKFNHKKINFKG